MKSKIEEKFIRLTEFGVNPSFSIQQKRSIILSNYLSVIFSCSSFLLLLNPENVNPGGFREVFTIIVVCVIPLIFNYFGLTKVSRPYLCWIPVIFIMVLMVNTMHSLEKVEVTVYDGLRIYLLAFSCVPFLLFGQDEKFLFALSVLPTFICIVFCDQILTALGVGYEQVGVPVAGYHFTQTRTLIAYVIISGGCFSLKSIITNNDRFNRKLLAELDAKNSLLKAQSQSELKQVNDQLMANLEALEERELMIKKSQRIAGLGSWERDIHTGKVYWSEEMYNIFGVDKTFDLNHPDLMKILFGESGKLISEAFQRLLNTREPYDFTFETKTPIGYVKWVRILGFPIISNDEITSVNGIVHDVTRYKESEELIRANERKYRSLFEQASDAIMITDFKGKFVDVNESMCKMLGYSKEELLQLNIGNVIDAMQLKENPIAFDMIAQGHQIFSERKMLRKGGEIVFVEANVKMIGLTQVMAMARDISERKQIEKEKDYARYLLRERIKELTTLYKASQILAQEQKLVEEVLQEIVMILPEGWQYSSDCVARIICGEKTFITPNFKETPYRQFAEFNVQDFRTGIVEIFYLTEKPEEVEGPFLFEERNLINVIAEMLQIYLIRKRREDELNASQANLRATINNTEILIWSVDRNFNVLTFNEPFAKHIKERYHHDLKIGQPILPAILDADGEEVRQNWHSYFLRALTGEIVKIEAKRFGINFVYSLSPIIENSNIIGVSVIADDITEQKEREKALADAQMKIGELRLAALRSVMNPHFIFNALNSIQYFITKNDRLNAINYLSTFSKLIRGILTNSVSNSIKLSDEIELLKHYINLELLRFENKFTFQLNVDQDLDLESVSIPSLLIQPYVENAILHGLYNKQEPGKLTISIKDAGSAVLFKIEDDGIGREAAAKLRAQNFPKHKSIGMALTEERLRLINTDNKISFEIEDLTDNGKPSGTRIKILIPV